MKKETFNWPVDFIEACKIIDIYHTITHISRIKSKFKIGNNDNNNNKTINK